MGAMYCEGTTLFKALAIIIYAIFIRIITFLIIIINTLQHCSKQVLRTVSSRVAKGWKHFWELSIGS